MNELDIRIKEIRQKIAELNQTDTDWSALQEELLSLEEQRKIVDAMK